MNFVESDFRIMGVKRWKTRVLESYGKEKKKAPLSWGKPRPKSKGPYCSSRSY